MSTHLGGPPPPAHVLHLLPTAVHQAGVTLVHLDINVSWNWRTTWKLDDHGISDLRGLAKTLKVFNYRGPPDFPKIKTSSMENYMIALTSGEDLEKIDIAFQHSGHSKSTSIGSVLASLPSGMKLHSEPT